MSATLISLSGAQLRALNTPEAAAELARRKAKLEAKMAAGQPVRVASLRANGYADLANERIAHAQAAKAAKPAAKAAFTRTTEVALVTKRDSIAKVRADFDGRVGAVEQAVLHLATLASTQAKVLEQLVARKAKKAV